MERHIKAIMEEDSLSIQIEYRFSSCIGSREESDCIKEYLAVLYEGIYADIGLNEYAGEMKFKIIYLSQAENEGLDIYELFDTYEYTFRHGQNFYDFKRETFAKPLLKAYPDLEFNCSKICIVETMGVIPKFRGQNVGAKAFKDLVWNFGQDCPLFIIQPYPLQFEFPENNTNLLSKLELEKFEKNKKKATESLSKYYQSWGFQKIKGIKDLLFYCALYRNEAFENIEME